MIKENIVLLPCCYLPPISYFSVWLNSPAVWIEQHENFVKSTFRNRCVIVGTNGKLMLSIPIEGGKSHRQLFKDTRIDNSQRWQRIHWQSLCSAYRRSAYFEYFEEKLFPYYHQKFTFLFDYNLQLTSLLLSMMKHTTTFSTTKYYQKIYEAQILDLRECFSTSDSYSFGKYSFSPPHYFQCFEERNGFLPNVSVVDILFNMGPACGSMIKDTLCVL
ncbi:MAG: WbqC family protein [Chitinophagales bacterium]|nr:WbqC family protein [Chitinophagales bacterium]